MNCHGPMGGALLPHELQEVGSLVTRQIGRKQMKLAMFVGIVGITVSMRSRAATSSKAQNEPDWLGH